MLEQLQATAHIWGSILIILLIIYCVILTVRLNGLTKKYNFFMRGEDGVSLERKLAVEIKEIRDLSDSLEGLFHEQEYLKMTQQHTFQKIGFVKYNAFDNIGNELSFSLTLLDGNNNGVVISSLYGRNESRIFSKPIMAGKSIANLSQEELESLHDALSNRHNGDVIASRVKE